MPTLVKRSCRCRQCRARDNAAFWRIVAHVFTDSERRAITKGIVRDYDAATIERFTGKRVRTRSGKGQ